MTKVGKALVFTSWVVVEPADDLPDVWVGHCLDFDVISQGTSPQPAVESVTEAVAMTLIDDVQNGLDPRVRRAPAEFWDRLAQVLKHGERVKVSELSADRKVVVATKIGKRPYTVPAHNGLRTEISWLYIQGLCRNMDIPTSAFTDD